VLQGVKELPDDGIAAKYLRFECVRMSQVRKAERNCALRKVALTRASLRTPQTAQKQNAVSGQFAVGFECGDERLTWSTRARTAGSIAAFAVAPSALSWTFRRVAALLLFLTWDIKYKSE
jgi:hypothetical protein